jgi:hypothetical protein
MLDIAIGRWPWGEGRCEGIGRDGAYDRQAQAILEYHQKKTKGLKDWQ